MAFRLTYATMFDPPEELHQRFEAALADVRASLGASHALHVDGKDVPAAESVEKRSPADARLVLGRFPLASAGEVERALAAAAGAFESWRFTPLAERVRLARRVGQLLEERVYRIAAVLALEVGKNRMEALGETQETADFFRGYAEELERRQGYDVPLPDDPLDGFRSRNRSVLKPYGAWAVITPFNFPLALAGGPTAAALVTGNTVVLKGASDTPWAGRLLADCIRDAGFPPGVFNYVTGRGSVVGESLLADPRLAGLTFTGSHEVGMSLVRRMAGGAIPRPCIAEMGGNNACVVTARADLERAATGILRSAFGLTGQKCSALSRLYVEEAVADELLERLASGTRAIRTGDPCLRENWMGPVVSAQAAASFEGFCARLGQDGGRVLEGGRRLTDGAHAHGHFVAPTLAEAPLAHPLYREEKFQPILMAARVKDVREGVAQANAVPLGLTAGCYGGPEDARYFLDHVEAGVTYVNRPQGATTGAWPFYQPFGGWKGSGSTGKAIGSFHYLPLYMREQSQTVVE
jgi:1-pyrroline-5-carboxylate dehydrogenase